MKRAVIWSVVVAISVGFGWYYYNRIQPVDMTNRAIALMRIGKFKEALPLLKVAHQRMPKNPNVLNPLAECHWALKQYSHSRRIDTVLLQLVPGHKQATHRMKVTKP